MRIRITAIAVGGCHQYGLPKDVILVGDQQGGTELCRLPESTLGRSGEEERGDLSDVRYHELPTLCGQAH